MRLPEQTWPGSGEDAPDALIPEDVHPDAKALFRDYWRETHFNGWDWKLGRYVPTHYPDRDKGVLLALKPMDSTWSKSYGGRGIVYGDWLMAVGDGRQGAATRALRWICALADHHNVVLKLTAGNTGQRGFKTLSPRVLVPFYKRFGFEVKGRKGSRDMVRMPRGLHLVPHGA